MHWYNKYENIPHKYLGNNPVTGLDCFSLCKYIIEQETNLTIPYVTKERINIAEEDWYTKTNYSYFQEAIKLDSRWVKINIPEKLSIILMSIGPTNVANHCALYLGNNKIIHTLQNKPSYVTSYGTIYKQYTLGVYKWNQHTQN